MKKIQEFHNVIGSLPLESPSLEDTSKVEEHIGLLKETIKSLEDAAYIGDLEEFLHALVDIQALVHGVALDLGMKDIFEKASNEVHNSNMSAFCKDTASARESVNFYLDEGIEAYYKKIGNHHLIFRASDNIVLKGKNYFKPRLKEIIQSRISQVDANKAVKNSSADH